MREAPEGLVLTEGTTSNPLPSVTSIECELSAVIARAVRNSLKTETIAALGVEPAGVIRNLLGLPEQIEQATGHITDLYVRLREHQNELREHEIPLRLQANADGKNETERGLLAEQLIRGNLDCRVIKQSIAELESSIAWAEASRINLIDLQKNTRAVAGLLAAVIGNGGRE